MTLKNQTNKDDLNQMSELQKDALQEVGNIGAAHAATALSNMLHETIMIDVTKSQIITMDEISELLQNGPTEKVAGVYMQVSGEGDNNLLMLFPMDNALRLVDMLFKRPKGTTKTLSPRDESAIGEIGNVCACAYLNALAGLLDLTLFPTPPGIAVDMLQAVLQFPVLEMGTRLEYIVIIETELIQNSTKFKGYFLFMPDTGVQKAIMNTFKIDN